MRLKSKKTPDGITSDMRTQGILLRLLAFARLLKYDEKLLLSIDIYVVVEGSVGCDCTGRDFDCPP